MRTFKLVPSCLIVAVGAVPVLVACGGQVSLGTNKSQLSQVDPVAVGGAVPACATGAAHPNVCCRAEAGQPAQCGTYPGAPFEPCESGWTTYPDPRSCCALEDPAQCAPPPPSPPPTPPGVCGYLCEPGWYPIPNGCCQATPNGDGVCYGWASGGGDGGTPDGGFTDGGVVDAGPFDGGAFDGGVLDDGAAPPVADAGPPPQPPTPPCDFACPTGWQHASGAPDLCCRDVPGGGIECFSQATGPTGPTTPPSPGDAGSTDAGPPSIDGGVADASPLACGSNGTDCSCQATIGGHDYQLHCSDTGQVCTCVVDGAGQSYGGVAVCAADGGPTALDSFWTNVCKFPR